MHTPSSSPIYESPFSYLEQVDLNDLKVTEIARQFLNYPLIIYPWSFFVTDLAGRLTFNKRKGYAGAMARKNDGSTLKEQISAEEKNQALYLYMIVCKTWFTSRQYNNCITAIKNLETYNFLGIENITAYKKHLLHYLWESYKHENRQELLQRLLTSFPEMIQAGYTINQSIQQPALKDLRTMLATGNPSDNFTYCEQLFQEISSSDPKSIDAAHITKLSGDLLLLERNEFDHESRRTIAIQIVQGCIGIGGDYTTQGHYWTNLVSAYNITLSDLIVDFTAIMHHPHSFLSSVLGAFPKEQRDKQDKDNHFISDYFEYFYNSARFTSVQMLESMGRTHNYGERSGLYSRLKVFCINDLGNSNALVTELLYKGQWKLALQYLRSIKDSNEALYKRIYNEQFTKYSAAEDYDRVYDEIAIDIRKYKSLSDLMNQYKEKIIGLSITFSSNCGMPEVSKLNKYFLNDGNKIDTQAMKIYLVNAISKELAFFEYKLRSLAPTGDLYHRSQFVGTLVGSDDSEYKRLVFSASYNILQWGCVDGLISIGRYFGTISDSFIPGFRKSWNDINIPGSELWNYLQGLKEFNNQRSKEQQFIIYSLLTEKDGQYFTPGADKTRDDLAKAYLDSAIQTTDSEYRTTIRSLLDSNILCSNNEPYIIRLFESYVQHKEYTQALSMCKQYRFLADKTADIQYKQGMHLIDTIGESRLDAGSIVKTITRTDQVQQYFITRINEKRFPLRKIPKNRDFLMSLYKQRTELGLSGAFIRDIAEYFKMYFEDKYPNLESDSSIQDGFYHKIIEEQFPDSEQMSKVAEYRRKSCFKGSKKHRGGSVEENIQKEMQDYMNARTIASNEVQRLEEKKKGTIEDAELDTLILERKAREITSAKEYVKTQCSHAENNYTTFLRGYQRYLERYTSELPTAAFYSNHGNKYFTEFDSARASILTYHLTQELFAKNFLGKRYKFVLLSNDDAQISKVKSICKNYDINTDRIHNTSFEAKAAGIENTKMQQKLRSFLSQTQNPDRNTIAELIALFGINYAANILLCNHPEYKKLDHNQIISIISEYLGEFLLIPHGFTIHHIPENLNISGNDYINNVKTILEKEFLEYYNQEKQRKANNLICNEYINGVKEKLSSIKESNTRVYNQLLEVIQGFHTELIAICDMKKPDSFVKSLLEGREFPDFLQKLNAFEVKNKKRFLIADGMGMGKSLSSLLAIEHLGMDAKPCLITTPSNVINTRTKYLSPAPTGYFLEDKPPRIKVIRQGSELQQDLSQFDYVLVSHELIDRINLEDNAPFFGKSLIVDEVHKLKNVSSGKRAGALLKIAAKIEKNNGYLCMLSGTPIPNKIKDIIILLKILYPEQFADEDDKSIEKKILEGKDVELRSLLLPKMQMKKLTDHHEMPSFTQETKRLDLGEKEREYYDAILDDDSMTASQKIPLLRKFLLNPKTLGISDTECTKATAIGKDSNNLFKTKKRIVYFVNGPISGIIRKDQKNHISEEETFIAQMGLDKDIAIKVIDGDTPAGDRIDIQKSFNDEGDNQKIALFISGSIGDVGIDLTGGEHIIHINEPRTQADKDQQEARVYRFGQTKPITSTTYITNRSIEEGINKYIKIKQDAILKLYYGIQLTESERDILKKDISSDGDTQDNTKAVNAGLSEYFKKSSRELNEFFGCMKQAGSDKITNIIENDGKTIAGYYKDLGPRSYQSNVNRVCAQIISNLLGKEVPEHLSIVDIGSGPKMLHRQMPPGLQQHIISMDINPHHFSLEDLESKSALVGDFTNASNIIEPGSVDFINCSLAFHDTSRNPDAKDYERYKLLVQINKALKVGGHALITLPYSLELENDHELDKVLNRLGLSRNLEYCGPITGENFSVNSLCIRKTRNISSWDDRPDALRSAAEKSALTIKKNKTTLKNQKKVLQEVNIGGKVIPLTLTQEAKYIMQLEQSAIDLIQRLIMLYKKSDTDKSASYIPPDILQQHGFGRYYNEGSVVLVKRLYHNDAMFSYRETISKN